MIHIPFAIKWLFILALFVVPATGLWRFLNEDPTKEQADELKW